MTKEDENKVKELIKKELSSKYEAIIKKELVKQLGNRETEGIINKMATAILIKFFKILWTRSASWSNDLK